MNVKILRWKINIIKLRKHQKCLLLQTKIIHLGKKVHLKTFRSNINSNPENPSGFMFSYLFMNYIMTSVCIFQWNLLPIQYVVYCQLSLKQWIVEHPCIRDFRFIEKSARTSLVQHKIYIYIKKVQSYKTKLVKLIRELDHFSCINPQWLNRKHQLHICPPNTLFAW